MDTPVMNINEPQRLSQATDYLETFRNLWPVLAACYISAFFWGLRRIKNSYKHQNILSVLGNLLFTSLSSMVLGFGSVLVLPYFYADVTPGLEIGVGILVSIMGQKIIDIFIMKKLGLSTVDLMNRDDVSAIRDRMTEKDRIEHAKQCPFKEDMRDGDA